MDIESGKKTKPDKEQRYRETIENPGTITIASERDQ
jgi:hypothetical protein